MKSFALLAVLTIFASASNAQLTATPVCPPFVVDVLEGHINKVYPKATQGEILKVFPCATDVLAEDSAQCAGVFMKDKGVSFFTDRDYIEIGENYQGKTSIPIMGADRNSLFNLLGNPKLKDNGWQAYQMQYGSLVVYYGADGKINKLQFTNRNTETLKLCK